MKNRNEIKSLEDIDQETFIELVQDHRATHGHAGAVGGQLLDGLKQLYSFLQQHPELFIYFLSLLGIKLPVPTNS
jgi:hypothetical protein